MRLIAAMMGIGHMWRDASCERHGKVSDRTVLQAFSALMAGWTP